MRIKAMPVLNEFDTWEPCAGHAIKKSSLYVVEASEFDLFFTSSTMWSMVASLTAPHTPMHQGSQAPKVYKEGRLRQTGNGALGHQYKR